jgi:elongation factor P
MKTTADLSKETVMRWKNDLYSVVEFQHVNPGKGSAFVRTRLKNVRTGKVIENTFKSGEAIDVVDVEKKKMQYLFSDATTSTFMDQHTYEQVAVPKEMIGDRMPYLKEGLDCMIVLFEGNPVNIELPKKITYLVTAASEAVRGDTSNRATKEVELETGLKINAPIFIKQGEKVVVSSETGEYVERTAE